eukprot:1147913-Pelagomonas_calceolata.AAC.3
MRGLLGEQWQWWEQTGVLPERWGLEALENFEVKEGETGEFGLWLVGRSAEQLLQLGEKGRAVRACVFCKGGKYHDLTARSVGIHARRAHGCACGRLRTSHPWKAERRGGEQEGLQEGPSRVLRKGLGSVRKLLGEGERGSQRRVGGYSESRRGLEEQQPPELLQTAVQAIHGGPAKWLVRNYCNSCAAANRDHSWPPLKGRCTNVYRVMCRVRSPARAVEEAEGGISGGDDRRRREVHGIGAHDRRRR